MEHQRECIEHLQYGKQIGKILDLKSMQKRPQARKPILLGLEFEKPENWIPNFEIFENILIWRTKFPCRMDQTLFQTSS